MKDMGRALTDTKAHLINSRALKTIVMYPKYVCHLLGRIAKLTWLIQFFGNTSAVRLSVVRTVQFTAGPIAFLTFCIARS